MCVGGQGRGREWPGATQGLSCLCTCDHEPMCRPVPPQVPTKTSGKSYMIGGVITQVDNTTLDITELPVRKWTQVGGWVAMGGDGWRWDPGGAQRAASVRLMGEDTLLWM